MAVEWHGDDILDKIRGAAMIGVVSGTEAVRALAVDKIQKGPKSGRLYFYRTVVHQASAPGEAPASDTGYLVRNATTEYDYEKLTGYCVFRTEYAASLEFGTVLMEPRPYARSSLIELSDQIRQGISDEIAAVLK